MFRSEKTFGTSSPKRIVNIVSGTTTTAMARTLAIVCDRWSPSWNDGVRLSAAPGPADGRGNGRQQRHGDLDGRQAGLDVLLHVQGGLGPGAVLADQDLQASRR